MTTLKTLRTSFSVAEKMATNNDVQWRFLKLASDVVGEYRSAKTDETVTLAVRQRGVDGTEIILLHFDDKEKCKLRSVNHCLINDHPTGKCYGQSELKHGEFSSDKSKSTLREMTLTRAKRGPFFQIDLHVDEYRYEIIKIKSCVIFIHLQAC